MHYKANVIAVIAVSRQVDMFFEIIKSNDQTFCTCIGLYQITARSPYPVTRKWSTNGSTPCIVTYLKERYELIFLTLLAAIQQYDVWKKGQTVQLIYVLEHNTCNIFESVWHKNTEKDNLKKECVFNFPVKSILHNISQFQSS